MRRLHSRRAHLNQSSTVIFFIMSHASSSAARVMMQVWQTVATSHMPAWPAALVAPPHHHHLVSVSCQNNGNFRPDVPEVNK
jgi:hypothetical protein